MRFNSYANHLEFAIKDTGVGISQEEVPNLFKPFFKLPENNHMHKKGVGLNLYIAKLLIKKLNGKVKVYSKKGFGTEIYFSVEAENSDPVSA